MKVENKLKKFCEKYNVTDPLKIQECLKVFENYNEVKAKTLKEICEYNTRRIYHRYSLCHDRYNRISRKRMKYCYNDDKEKLQWFDKKNRSGSIRCAEYWLKRGYSEEEADQKIQSIQKDYSKRQTGIKRSEKTKKLLSDSIKYSNTVEYFIEKYGEELGELKYQEHKNNQRLVGLRGIEGRKKRNPNTFIEGSIRRKEYWLKKGFTEDQAKDKIYNLQNRSLKYFTSKYGDELGELKWKSRLENWKQSMSKLDQEEINEKRKLNAHVGTYSDRSIENIDYLNLYVLLFKNNVETPFIKYGLTKQNEIHKRWKKSLEYEVLYFKKLEAKDALDIEIKLNERYKNSLKQNFIRTTECFEYNSENITEMWSLINEKTSAS